MRRRQQLATIIRRIPKLMLIPYYTYRFFQPKYSVGVVGLVINEQREILLVEHVFHPKLPWGLPGGWIGNNEDPSEAVIRELSEELKLSVGIQSLLLMRRTQYNHLDIAYLCQTQSDIGVLSYELLSYDWFSQDKLPPLHNFHYEAINAAFLQWDKE
jgi:ADP-ribose pyrophosphatase YjhB (NUDIX family)